MGPHFEVSYLPYAGLRPDVELRFGKARLWHSAKLDHVIQESALREKVQSLLRMNRQIAGDPNAASPVEGIGILSIGDMYLQVSDTAAVAAFNDLRVALFLARLRDGMTTGGPNAGHNGITAENFTMVRQGFTREGEYTSETNGVLIKIRTIGHKIASATFPRPAWVNTPLSFSYEEDLFCELQRLHRRDRKLLRRLLLAGRLFLESSYNAQSLDLGARVLLQAAAFEALLGLNNGDARKAFKEQVEARCAPTGTRKYRYRFETRRGRQEEHRTVHGIWADRFFTLRNHIVHGETVNASEYLFRKSQHHLAISPLFFLGLVKSLLDETRRLAGMSQIFSDRIDWVSREDEHFPEDSFTGFLMQIDFGRRYAEWLETP